MNKNQNLFSDLLLRLRRDAYCIIREIRNGTGRINDLLLENPLINERNVPPDPVIYFLTSINGKKKSYVGESLNGKLRMECYKFSNSNKNQIIVRAIRKHGWDNFEKRILYKFDYLTYDMMAKMNKEEKIKIKQVFRAIETSIILKYKLRNKIIGYNIAIWGLDRSGCINSAETREKISKANIGKKASDETKRKLSISRRKRITTQETKAKISISMKEKIIKEETREKLRIANTGKKRSPEMKESYRQAKIGSKASEETKLKMSLAHKGKYCGKDSWLYGKKQSLETISKRVALLKKPINQLNLETGKVIKTWDSASDAAKYLFDKPKKSGVIIGVCKKRIQSNGSLCKSAYGFGWEYCT